MLWRMIVLQFLFIELELSQKHKEDLHESKAGESVQLEYRIVNIMCPLRVVSF